MDTNNTKKRFVTDVLSTPPNYDDVFITGLCNSCQYQENLLITPDGNFCADCCTLGNKKVKLNHNKDIFIKGSCNACQTVDKLLVLPYGNFCADCCTLEGYFK